MEDTSSSNGFLFYYREIQEISFSSVESFLRGKESGYIDKRGRDIVQRTSLRELKTNRARKGGKGGAGGRRRKMNRKTLSV